MGILLSLICIFGWIFLFVVHILFIVGKFGVKSGLIVAGKTSDGVIKGTELLIPELNNTYTWRGLKFGYKGAKKAAKGTIDLAKVGVKAAKVTVKLTAKTVKLIFLIIRVILFIFSFASLLFSCFGMIFLMIAPATAGGAIVAIISTATIDDTKNKFETKTDKLKNSKTNTSAKTGKWYHYKQSSTPTVGVPNGLKEAPWYDDIIRTDPVKKIGASGCGWCSLVVTMENLNSDKCGGINPRGWLDIMPADFRKANWTADQGMSWNAPRNWVSKMNEIGKYGKWKLISDNQQISTQECLNIIKKYAGDDDKAVVLSSSTGLFTGGGHIICCIDYNKENKTFHILDSSGRSATLTNTDWHKIPEQGFPIDKTSYEGYAYNLKCAWVIKFEGN